MDITDTITFCISIFLMMRGFGRGFMNSIIGPISIIITSILSIVYYQAFQNLVVALLIGTIGPLILTFIFKFVLQSWSKATNNDVKPSFLSCLGGALMTLLWGWVFIAFTLIILSLIPTWDKTLGLIQSDVVKSASYQHYAKPLASKFFSLPSDNSTVTAAANNTDVASLAQDPRIQKVLQDPQVQQEINSHDMVKLMSDPKMIALTKEIMSDPDTMKKFMSIYTNQIKTSTPPGGVTK